MGAFSSGVGEPLLCTLDPNVSFLCRRVSRPAERQDEVVYYDAYESPDAMLGGEEGGVPPSPLTEEQLAVLQNKTRQLEARRGRITSKRAYLKNKKVGAPRFCWALGRQAAVLLGGRIPQSAFSFTTTPKGAGGKMF
jgi:hypothetical protein